MVEASSPLADDVTPGLTDVIDDVMMTSWTSASTPNRSGGSSPPSPGSPVRTSPGQPRCSSETLDSIRPARAARRPVGGGRRDHRQPRWRHHRRAAQRHRAGVRREHDPAAEDSFADADAADEAGTPGSRCACQKASRPGSKAAAVERRRVGQCLAGPRDQPGARRLAGRSEAPPAVPAAAGRPGRQGKRYTGFARS